MARVAFDRLCDLVTRIFAAHGMTTDNAGIIARVLVEAERDGTASHGLFRISGYLATLKSGHVDGRAVPVVDDVAPGVVRIDAGNGFAQAALAAGRALAVQKARTTGIAVIAIHNSHHFAPLWADVEPFAEQGLVALALVNSRMRIAPWDADRKLIGTNPMAFASPRAGKPPLVWDQASSVMAQGQVLLAAKEGQQLPPDTLIDRDGNATSDPNELMRGGALRAFGGYKGSSIALMVEILAGALTGGQFGFEDTLGEQRGSATQNAGELLIVIDPARFGNNAFPVRVDTLLSHLRAGGVSRLPAELRYKMRLANRDGIPVEDDTLRGLEKLADGADNQSS
jgi:delta1-piperideine-2-carboxylate reductase